MSEIATISTQVGKQSPLLPALILAIRYLKLHRFPGCTNTKFVDGHHIKHWADGDETKPSNLISLCRFHHRKVHEGAVQALVTDDGAFRVVQPNGQAFDRVAKIMCIHSQTGRICRPHM
jgi:hypothetical protein